MTWLRFAMMVTVVYVVMLFAVFARIDARATEVDTRLVLLVDVSASMSTERLTQQRDGYMQAIRHPDVLRVIEGGPHGRVAVTVIEFSGQFDQRTIVPWSLIGSAPDADAVAAVLATQPIVGRGQTALGAAIRHALAALQASPYSAVRSVIDVSGDGITNDGVWPSEARDEAIAAGVQVNGLPILSAGEPTLYEHYETQVIGGPGAFLIPVADMAEFPTALRRKLTIELAGYRPIYAGVW
jgi:hypothetical protein